MRFSGRLIRNVYLSDLYKGEDVTDFEKGVIALVAYKRIAHCLEAGLNLNVSSSIFQWTEERSPNHHKYIYTPKWPVGFINLESPAYFVDTIRQFPELNEYNLKIVNGSNSSGGVLQDNINKYLFSVDTEYCANNDYLYKEIDSMIDEKFGDNGSYRTTENNLPKFKFVNGFITDFVRVEGFDRISGGRVIIDIGNRPIIKKYPKNWMGFKTNFGQIPPLNSLKVSVF
ncbi:MAG TPA: hypothetical protein P5277_00240 [Candidatus Paceibacterota bacterium]|nr:hypothetical protein [Candidatus Paceibacterota bacterium]